MVKQVSFSTGAAPAVPQINPLVAALLRQSLLNNRPVRSVTQGLDKLGKAALAAFLQSKIGSAADAKEAGFITGFQDAQAAGGGAPERSIAPSLADITPGTELDPSGGFRTPAVSPDKQAFINALLGNKETARFGARLAARDIFNDPQETFTPVFGSGGEVVGQRSSTSGRVVADPRTPKGADVSLAQSANNAEIDAARSRLLALRLQLQPGQTLRDLVISQTQRADDTGLGNPSFNPLTLSDLRTASQRKVGDDPGFNEFFDQLDVAAALPPSESVPVPEPEGPGFLSRAFETLFGGGDAAAGLPAAGSLPESLNAPATPSRRGRFPPRGVGRSSIDTLAAPVATAPAQPRARGGRGPRRAGTARSISRMSARELNDLLNERGNALSPAERQEVDARLRALGL